MEHVITFTADEIRALYHALTRPDISETIHDLTAFEKIEQAAIAEMTRVRINAAE